MLSPKLTARAEKLQVLDAINIVSAPEVVQTHKGTIKEGSLRTLNVRGLKRQKTPRFPYQTHTRTGPDRFPAKYNNSDSDC